MPSIHEDPEFKALRRVSARVGSDPLLVQAAGGNTSIKRDGVLWIKASGTWLMHAERDEVFVPVDIGSLMEAFENRDGAADKAQDFVLSDLNPSGLRPSIETTVHSVIQQEIVIHVHCVGTIAHAVREDAGEALTAKLAGLDWAFVPYIKPGVTLARSIRQALTPETRVIILGNHGLVVCGDNVVQTEALMDEVHKRLTDAPRETGQPDLVALNEIAGDSGYKLPRFAESHGVALDEQAISKVTGGSLYPDHVIFLGIGSVVARQGETLNQVRSRITQAGMPEPVCIIFPGKGVLMHGDANAGAEALARCLSDVALRIPGHARLVYLSDVENDELINWDAEKYRLALNRRIGTK